MDDRKKAEEEIVKADANATPSHKSTPEQASSPESKHAATVDDSSVKKAKKPLTYNQVLVRFFGVMGVIFVLCSGFLVYQGSQAANQRAAAVKAFQSSYSPIANDTVASIDKIMVMDFTKMDEKQSWQDVNVVLTAAKDKLPQLKSALPSEKGKDAKAFSAYQELDTDVTSVQGYLSTQICLADKQKAYNEAIKNFNDGFVYFTFAPGDGNYSKEVTRQQQTKDAILKVKEITGTLKECVSGDKVYADYPDNDAKNIDKFVTEYLDPFMKALKTGKQGTIQQFLNNSVSAHYLTLSWYNATKPTGSFTKKTKTFSDSLRPMKEKLEISQRYVENEYK